MLRSPHTSVLVLLGFARETVWFVCVVVAVCSGGCKSLQKDTISDEVIMARQMSLRGFDSLEQGELEDAEAWFANLGSYHQFHLKTVSHYEIFRCGQFFVSERL